MAAGSVSSFAGATPEGLVGGCTSYAIGVALGEIIKQCSMIQDGATRESKY